MARAGDKVSVLYVGRLANGTVFDSSARHGNQPFTFKLTPGTVIPGWVEGVAGMRVGGVRELAIPPALAYGCQTPGPTIPANSTLIFTIHLVAIA